MKLASSFSIDSKVIQFQISQLTVFPLPLFSIPVRELVKSKSKLFTFLNKNGTEFTENEKDFAQRIFQGMSFLQKQDKLKIVAGSIEDQVHRFLKFYFVTRPGTNVDKAREAIKVITSNPFQGDMSSWLSDARKHFKYRIWV